MSKGKFYKIENGKLYFKENEKIFDIQTIKKCEVVLFPAKKSNKDEVLNTVANFMSTSIANGNEKIHIGIKFFLDDNQVENILIHKDALIRNNLDYHKLVKEARLLQQELNNLKQMD